ncbi:MAG: site-2 protease family protein [Clostridia bacterium]|nr:site-2 protease family protein [Clostridia bacterium]
MDIISILETVGGILIALIALMLMVTIHEAGHYTVGKLLKFKINEFAIGFGKAIFKRKMKSGEIFSIRILPLGGYCAFDGEDEDENKPRVNEEGAEISSEGLFNKQKPWKRLLVLGAGAFFNFVSAILIIALTFCFHGDVLPCTEIRGEYVQENSVFEDHDIIISIDNTVFSFFNADMAHTYSDGEHVAVVRRLDENGRRYETTVKFNSSEYGFIDSSSLELYAYYLYKQGNPPAGFEDFEFDEKAYKSITEEQLIQNYEFVSEVLTRGNCVTYRFYRVTFSFFDAFGRAFSTVFRLVWLVISTLIGLFTGATPVSSLGGPITVISTLGQSATLSLGVLMYFVCLISANLAVFNLLPIPSLDGSRMVFVIIEWIRGKPLNRKVEALVHSIGLVVIFAFAIIVDVLKWF